MPFSYALAALLASAPVTGLVMSTPELPDAQAHSATRRTALQIDGLIAAFPFDPQRLGHARRPMAPPDQPSPPPPPFAPGLRLTPPPAAQPRFWRQLRLP